MCTHRYTPGIADNRASIPATYALTFERGSLRLDAPAAARVPPYFRWDERVSAWRTEAINHWHLAEDLAGYRVNLADGAPDFFPPPSFFPSLPPLRADQRAAVEAWEEAAGRGVIVKPTGTGKTEIALSIMARHRAPTLVVTPLRDLMYQWHRRIRKGLGVEAGVLGDGRREVWPVTVTTYDSAYIHMKEMGHRFRLIVYDEVHHLPAPSLRESALDCLAPLRLGLTATPERADQGDRMLDGLIGPVVYREELAEARGRTVADYEIVRVPIHLASDEQEVFDALSRRIRRYLSAQRKEDPAFDWTELARRSRTDPEAREIHRAWRQKQAILNRSAEKLRVLEDLFALHPAEPVVVFTASNRMALDVSARFLIPAITSHSDKSERNRVLDGFSSGAFPALVACQVLNEGWDAPAVKIGVVLGGDRGVREAVQRLGRVLRRSGDRRARLYEVYVQETADVARARRRNRSDAYRRAPRLSLGQANQLGLF